MALGEGDLGGDVHSMANAAEGGHAVGTSVMKGWGQSRADSMATKYGNSNANAFQVAEGSASKFFL